MIKAILLVFFLLALCARKPARAELAPPGKVTKYTRPDHWYYSLEQLPRVTFDIPYAGDASTPEQILHIAYPNKGEGPFPLMIYIHGGGWSLFNSQNHSVLYTGEACLYALERGYAAAFVDYRLTERSVMPHQLYDIKKAIRFLKANAARYALDPDRFILAGDSAGAHLASLAALTAEDPEYEDTQDDISISCAVKGVVSWHAVTDFSGELSELLGWFYGVDSARLTVEDIAGLSRMCSPLCKVTAAAPPFYLQHGLIDSETPYTQSCDLYNALMTKAPNPLHKLELFPGMEHAVSWFFSRKNMTSILDWMDEVLR